MTGVEARVPSEIWTPQTGDFKLGYAIEAARQEMNTQNPARLIHALNRGVKRSASGIVYSVLKGERPDEYSVTDALVMFNPFGNTATPNMLVRSEYIRLVAEQENIRDDLGKLKPVIMIASPGIFGSKLKLSKAEKAQVRSGELGSIAQKILVSVSAQEYGKVSLLGFSMGADLALAGAQNAYNCNLDLEKIAVGDPVGVEARSSLELALDFLKSGGQFQESIASGKLTTQQRTIGKSTISVRRNVDFTRFAIVSLTPTNRMLWTALGKNSFEDQVSRLLDNNDISKLVVGYGGISDITKPEVIEPQLGRLQSKSGDRLTSIRVESKNHSWGDQLPLLAKLYMKALA